MRLALRLGMTLHRVKRDISSAELAKWMAFDRIDPFTIDRTELILARFMALIANITGNQHATAADFLPFKRDQDQGDSFEKAANVFRGIFSGANQSTKRKP